MLGENAPRIRAGVIGRLRARDVWLHGQDACWERFNLVLEDLEARAPKAGWWLGRALSAADLSIFAQLHSLRTPLTEPQRDAVAARPRLSSWLDRVNDATLENLGERTQDDTRPAQSPQSPTLPPTQVRSLL